MHSDYLRAISPEKRVLAVNWLLDEIEARKLEFDTIAVRGFSATSIGSIIAHFLKKPICYVRKPEEKCNSSYRVEFGDNIGKYLIIDDLICTGETMQSIIDQIDTVEEKTECIGAILYVDKCFWTGKYLMKYRTKKDDDEKIPLSPVTVVENSYTASNYYNSF